MELTVKIGLTPKPNNLGEYEFLDVVSTGGSSYISLVNNNTYTIEEGLYWQKATIGAYDLAFATGYTGTEAEFALALAEVDNKIDKSSITSELGDSEELVMSQKGVKEKVKLPIESGEQAAAAALVELKKEVAYLKGVLSNVITYLQINTLSVNNLQIKGAPLFIFSDVVPAIVPDFAGQIYIKTTATAAAWIALGDSSVANWKEI